MAIYSEDEDPNIATAQGVQIKYSESEFKAFFESMVMKRFENVKEINNFILNGLGFNPDLELRNPEKDEQHLDNQLISNCTVNGEDLCYLDVYYLIDNGNRMYITEVSYDFAT